MCSSHSLQLMPEEIDTKNTLAFTSISYFLHFLKYENHTLYIMNINVNPIVCPLFFPEYVDEVRELVFSMSLVERNAILFKYKAGIPAPLNSQFTDKRSRAEAIENYSKRKQTETALYPSGEILEFECIIK